MAAPFVTSRRVEFRDTDAAGIMHFASIMGIMEEAEHDFLRDVELPLFRDVEGGKISWPRVSASCDFKSPARFEDLITIQVAVGSLTKKSVTYTFQLSCEDRVIAAGRMTSVCCLVSHGEIQSVEIPDDVVSTLRQYMADPAAL